jgi:hypothetical protein
VRFAELVIALDGHHHETDAPQQDELRVCERCWDELKDAPSLTLNGVTMVHDGSLHMRALPPNIGRG